MSLTIKTKQVNHVNCVMEGYEVSLAFFQNTYDAEYLLHVGKEDAYACLFQIGRVIFEQFSPRMWLLNSRYGAHYLGIEFQVESLDVARAAAKWERGIGCFIKVRLINDRKPRVTISCRSVSRSQSGAFPSRG